VACPPGYLNQTLAGVAPRLRHSSSIRWTAYGRCADDTATLKKRAAIASLGHLGRCERLLTLYLGCACRLAGVGSLLAAPSQANSCISAAP
jgi:hypothetical protein